MVHMVHIDGVTSDFSEQEMIFVKSAATGNTAGINQSRVVSDLILGKKIEAAADKMVASSKQHEESNREHSGRMYWLTWALVFVGGVQAIATLAQATPYIHYFMNRPN